MILSTWIFPAMFFLPYLLTDSIAFEEFELKICGIVLHESVWKVAYYHFSLLFDSISLTVIIFCNVKVYRKLRNHVANISLILPKSGSFAATNDVLKLTICCCICPLTFQLPAAAAKPWLTENEWVGRVLTMLFHFNSCLHPVITLYFMKPFYREFLRFFSRQNYTNTNTTRALGVMTRF